MARKPQILVANDDGIYGMGLVPLLRSMSKIGNVVAIVPDSERSAASHSITLHKPFRVQKFPMELGRNNIMHVLATNGTPADCVRFGVLKILKNKKIDLVVSGINQGLNLGEDTIYSGTVACAREAAMLGIKSMAVSVPHGSGRATFDRAAMASEKVARLLLSHEMPPRVFLNVNIPHLTDHKTAVMEVTRLGRRVYGKEISSGIDPRGQEFYWLAGDVPKGIPEVGTDIAALQAGKISVTPLNVDSTCEIHLAELSGRVLEEQYLKKR